MRSNTKFPHHHASKRHDRTNKLRSKKEIELIDLINLGNQLMEEEKFDGAAEMYAKVVQLQPSNPVALSNLGAALVKAGRIHEAKIVLEYALELNPKDINARINLGGVFQAYKDYHGALNNALDAVGIDPTSPVAFNNLGAAFSSINMMQEALHSYQTALKLDQKNLEAALNVATTLHELGRFEESKNSYLDLLDKIPENQKTFKELVKFYSSFIFLKLGDLETGWSYYESGFSTAIPIGAARTPNRKFTLPQWQGEDLDGKKLLVWREQGIGDELLFSSCMVDLVNLNANITFECSPRLVEIYKRSFPKFNIREESFFENKINNLNECFDYHIPIGSLPKLFRNKIDDFKNQKPFIKVNEEMSSDFKNKLSKYKDEILIGICWRSGTLDPLRNREYTHLSDWKDILTMKGYKFVNLQYGDCESELLEVEKSYGIEIIRWPDLDLKNELDRVFALMNCLDCVISAPTAVNCMAGSLGLPTLYLGSQHSWPTLGTVQGNYPWYPNTFVCSQSPDLSITPSLKIIPSLLKALFVQNKNHSQNLDKGNNPY